MPEPDLDQLTVFDPDAKPDPDEQVTPDPTEEVSEFEEAETYGGSGMRSQGYYGNANDVDNHAVGQGGEPAAVSVPAGMRAADDDPAESPHPIENRPDSEIQEDITAYLKQHTETDLSGVDFEVTAGTVILKGRADHRAREILEMTVRGVAGVHEIRNEVKGQ